MFDSRRRGATSKILLGASLLLLAPSLAKSQEAQNAPQPNASSAPAELTNEVRALTDTVRELQAQVKSLQSQVSELSAGQTGAPAEPYASSTRQKAVSSRQSPSAADAAGSPYSVFPAAEKAAIEAQNPAVPQTSSSGDETVEGRVSDLEDEQQLTDAKLADQSQTKIESGSKYRVRLSGMILAGFFENRGRVDNEDYPSLASPSDPFESDSAFGGSLRQTQIKLEVFGPELWGARTSANVDFDFAGGSPDAPNGAVLSLPRFRTGTIRLDWENTSIIAGQDFLFFTPLQPTSIATVAVPPLSYSGNLWAWTPQIRIEHRIAFSENSHLLLQGGILDSLTGDPPEPSIRPLPPVGRAIGTASVRRADRVDGFPARTERYDWGGRLLRTPILGPESHVNGWAETSDVTLPLGPLFTFTGSFYRGAGWEDWGEGSARTSCFRAVHHRVDGFRGHRIHGGWAQLKFKPTANFEMNGAFGQDNPFASQLRMYEDTTPAIYGSDLLARNRSFFVNFIYHPKSNVLLSVEYLRLNTFDLDDSYDANHINVGLGYIF